MASRCSSLRTLRLARPGATFCERCIQSVAEEGGGGVGQTVTKARSTAEQFSRMAAEKAEENGHECGKENPAKRKEAGSATTNVEASFKQVEREQPK